ncbi:MAG TPA: adenylyltransferase/cytidyltransferase family protein [Oleiagrimonas sp.]|nr:adenylyltransferase/cytidyltransferase family protein [Oleiagrimonas sp.]
MSTVVLTYGTFDLFHVGHLNLLQRLRDMGDRLVVGVSTDEFNALKGKRTIIRHEDRLRIVQGLKCVDLAIAEHHWEQKADDIRKHDVDIFGIGEDWKGHFDELENLCKVVYLPRTQGISSTQLKQAMSALDKVHLDELKQALGTLSAIVERFD